MQKITPFLWYDKEAREAAEFYVSVFKDGKIKGAQTMTDTPSGTVEVVTIELFGQEFTLMSAGPLFRFNEAISFVVNCESQDEADEYWEKLSAVPAAEQCGWLKDKFGVSWQITPTETFRYVNGPDKAGAARATQAMLRMKKLDVQALKAAYEGR